MLKTPTNMLFMIILISGTIISISSNSWFNAWIGLEINLLSMIPILSSTKNKYNTESALKYFLTQAIGSIILMTGCLLMALSSEINMTMHFSSPQLMMINSALLLKMGAAPFHFWFPVVMDGVSWLKAILLMTWQKLAPLMLFSHNITFNKFIMSIIVCSVTIGALGGLNQTSLRKIMTYSSINHTGWIIAAMMINEMYWMIYFTIYSLITTAIALMFNSSNTFHISQLFLHKMNDPLTKTTTFVSLLSLGGLPPFLGFLPKWMVIQGLSQNNCFLLITIMVMSTLITLFYYLRLMYSAMAINNLQPKWNLKNNFFQKNQAALFSLTLSLSGLMIVTMTNNLLS
uniref:NADH-ubiquinone oxidoreductase chain 2 n=1 Tax=Tricholepidion gertschi TaxID=89825 RepID=Q85QS7_9INSE|nr:NADH dehydrogenase subunit 2 [Tricholepidion gertschi]AAO40219.1 NADH dehydrogenase subunit 2 [Tricholepidion gertschi]